jgi:mannose-6-phosphate isomerase-like protein (cupin superfamily)
MKETGLGLIGLIGLVHEDARRAISEFNTDDWGFSVQQFRIKEKIPLGNHYHKRKDEIFVILKGSGHVILQKVGESKVKETILLKTGSVIYVPKNMAHTFVLEPDSEMICFSTKAFDKDDMHPFVLVK